MDALVATTPSARPYTRWWWPGGALDAAALDLQLDALADAGFGGVEVSPIYGVPTHAAHFTDFLSPRWRERFAHAVRGARRRGLGIDLILGTGWPWGGPWVAPADAAWRLDTHQKERLALRPTGQKVKRAAPGGEGAVLDHFSAAAVGRYLAHFDSLLADPATRPDTLFNDSWEVYGANATPQIAALFERRCGYPLAPYVAALFGEGDPETVRRVRADYRLTLAEAIEAACLRPWTAWAHRHGLRTRHQAHGSPGNLLDLYAAVDIPETECFGPAVLALAGRRPLWPGARPLPDTGEDELLVCRFAASAAHLTGKRLVSCEAFTWLGEHGHVPLDHLKAEADLLFASGVNRLVFHGTMASPDAAHPEGVAWPGWLFYAATHTDPRDPAQRSLPALNAYLTRCQAALQTGEPDADLWLYFPFHDLLSATPGQGVRDLLRYLNVHQTADWLRADLGDFHAAATGLTTRGWPFELASDALIASETPRAPAVIALAGCTLLPPATLAALLRRVEGGAVLAVLGTLPDDVPGRGRLTERRAALRALLDTLRFGAPDSEAIATAHRGEGRVLIGTELEALLGRAGLRRERAAESGVRLIRRRLPDGRLYFLANHTEKPTPAWLPLAAPARHAALIDPLPGHSRPLALRRAGVGEVAVALSLAPGESALVRTAPRPLAGPFATERPTCLGRRNAGEGIALDGSWEVAFLEGGPSLPPPREIAELTSWTEWEGDDRALRRDFSGVVRYRLRFELPAVPRADGWMLELGEVCHTARARFNGRALGDAFCRPFRLALPEPPRRGGNVLEVEVANLAANRLAARDRSDPDWPPFFLVDIDYRPFSAAGWPPLVSGLLGPVRLVPLKNGA